MIIHKIINGYAHMKESLIRSKEDFKNFIKAEFDTNPKASAYSVEKTIRFYGKFRSLNK